MTTDPELRAVRALRSLSIFGAGQAAAYREHFSLVSAVFGRDARTKIAAYIESWVHSSAPGVVILTGNAGTGKTALAQTFCEAAGGALPARDALVQVIATDSHAEACSRYVAKDLSGIPSHDERVGCLEIALARASDAQVLICANEGMLRNSLRGSTALQELLGGLERALRAGAYRSGNVLIVNLNRQRPTAEGLWDALVSFLSREDVWDGCHDCPGMEGGCPMRANAQALRKDSVREGIRLLVRYASGSTAPTLRDVLSTLAWAIVGDSGDQGGLTCARVKGQVRDNGPRAFEARNAYFSQLFGLGLPPETIERSPVVEGMLAAELGERADLEVDEWLRDDSGAPREIAALAVGSTALGRVETEIGTLSFEQLGEAISTSEDTAKVERCVRALNDEAHPAMAMWRRRVFFEGASVLGGTGRSARRLLGVRFFPELLEVAERCSRGASEPADLHRVLRGLNMLVTGYPKLGEGLIVPDTAALFSRDPGAYSPARPCIVRAQVSPDVFSLRCPDRGLVTEILDVDHIEIELAAYTRSDEEAVLRIGPDMYEAIRSAGEFGGPVGRAEAEMADIRDFYGRLSLDEGLSDIIHVTDPDRSASSLISISLPSL